MMEENGRERTLQSAEIDGEAAAPAVTLQTGGEANREPALLAARKAMSKGYILMTLAMDYFDECELQLKKIGLCRFRLKQIAGRVQREYGCFCDAFKPLLTDGDGEAVLRDFEELKGKVDALMDAEKGGAQ